MRAATAATGSSTAPRCGSPTAIVAQIAIVWAQTEEGIQGFIVPDRHAGLHRAGHQASKMSLRASVTSALFFDNVRIPDSQPPAQRAGLKGPLSA
jgi:glutaryl-CoA dehydrogenase